MTAQMKLWEVISTFRDGSGTLANVMGSARWRDPYLGFLQQFDELVTDYRRDVLDSVVPIELSRELAARCKRLFYYSPQSGVLRGDHHCYSSTDIQMTALEVHDRFGGSIIGEVAEKGSARIVSNGA